MPPVTRSATKAQRVAAPPNFPLEGLLNQAVKVGEQLRNQAPSTSAEPLDPPPTRRNPLKRSADSMDAGPCSSRTPAPSMRRPVQPLSVEPTLPLSGQALRKQRMRQQKSKEAWEAKEHEVRPEIREKYLKTIESIPSDLHLPALPVSSVGFTALRNDPHSKGHLRSLQDLVDSDYTVIPWTAEHNMAFTAGQDDRVFIMCQARPTTGFEGVHEDAHEFMQLWSVKNQAAFTTKEHNHLRGHFPQLVTGIAHGGGRVKAANWVLGKHTNAMPELLGRASIVRLAESASKNFNSFAPNLYRDYRNTLDKAQKHDPSLKRNFERSVFSCAAFNFPPNVATLPHRDSENLPFGWCVVQALGNFDATKGGHLVLDDLRVAIEFPAGASIYLPSATLTHSNVPVREGESRSSFTQYTPGHLFRWVENGCKTDSQLTTAEEQAMEEKRKTRWADGIKKWSTFSELCGDA